MPASARSGNPAKRAAAKKPSARQATAKSAAPTTPSSVADFKKGTAAEVLELPSGKSAQIRRIPLTSLLAEGLLGDSLGALAQRAVDAGEGMKPQDIKEMSQDPQKIMEALDIFDKIAAKCFVNPPVTYHKIDGKDIPEEERDPDILYSDELDIQDKVYVFQVIAGGSSDLQRFRIEFEKSVAGISASS